MKPIIVYYLHYKDPELREQCWSSQPDFASCVMAKDQAEAIEKVKKIAGGFIKIMGCANGREEWVNEDQPLGTGENTMPQGGWGNKV